MSGSPRCAPARRRVAHESSQAPRARILDECAASRSTRTKCLWSSFGEYVMRFLEDNGIVIKLRFWVERALRRTVRRPEIKIFGPEGGAADGHVSRVYVINLDRQRRRWKHFVREAQSQNLPGKKNLFELCQRVSAIDGRDIDSGDFLSTDIEAQYSLEDHFFVDPDPALSHIENKKHVLISTSPAEIAVSLSHLKVWRRMVDEKIPYALVLEDDVYFGANFAEQTNHVWTALPPQRDDGYRFDLLYLSYHEIARGNERPLPSNGLFRPIRGLWWLSAYVLSYSGAKKLLESLPIRGPVDLWMNHQFKTLDVFATSVSVISQRPDWKSDNSYSIAPVLSRFQAEAATNGKMQM